MAPFASTEQFTTSERERVLRAMAELCAERGYRETTVEALIERAGVGRESFESMFKDGMDECLLAAVNAIMGETVSVVSGAYSADESEWDSAIAGIRAILELMAANPSYASLGYVVGRQEGPPEVKQVYESGVNVLVVMLDRLRDYGEWDAQPPNAARAALGGAEALVRREIVAGRVEQLPRHLPDFVYVATVPFLGQEEALGLARRAREAMAGSAWGYDGEQG
jgi:AcrR family transcriptional regulator